MCLCCFLPVSSVPSLVSLAALATCLSSISVYRYSSRTDTARVTTVLVCLRCWLFSVCLLYACFSNIAIDVVLRDSLPDELVLRVSMHPLFVVAYLGHCPEWDRLASLMSRRSHPCLSCFSYQYSPLLFPLVNSEDLFTWFLCSFFNVCMCVPLDGGADCLINIFVLTWVLLCLVSRSHLSVLAVFVRVLHLFDIDFASVWCFGYVHWFYCLERHSRCVEYSTTNVHRPCGTTNRTMTL